VNRQEAKLVRAGMKGAVKAFHKVANNGVCELDPAIKEAYQLLDVVILDLKESLGYKRNGDWEKI
jgi:hypothetical protein